MNGDIFDHPRSDRSTSQWQDWKLVEAGMEGHWEELQQVEGGLWSATKKSKNVVVKK